MKYCIIIGTKKGATSSIYEYIRQHPSVIGGFKKEPNFFGNIKNWQKGIRWYEEQFVGFDPDQHVWGLDATTDYTQEGFLNIPKRMYESGRDMKFIYILRDPFKKIESQTHQFLIDGDSIRPIFECIDVRIVESAKYFKQLSRYLKYFPKEQFLLLDFKRVSNDLDGVMKDISEFLKLESFNFDTEYHHNKKESAIGQSYKGYRALRSVLRKLRLTPLIPQIAKDRLRLGLGAMGTKKIDASEFTLTLEQKQYLKQELLEDAKLLEQEFNFDTSAWEIHHI